MRSSTPILEVDRLQKFFPLKARFLSRHRPVVQAVDGVSFQVYPGETLGIVGESGCGKSTLARLLMRLIEPDRGTIRFAGKSTATSEGMDLRHLRRRVQMVFQDSFASLNPRLTVEESIAFAPLSHGTTTADARKKVDEFLALVGLEPRIFKRRYPHELSGGQRQRVNIARALALGPELLIMDEAVSALDKSVQAQIINLLGDLKRQLALTYVFISHDLNIVRYLCDRVMVMYLGKVAEVGPVEELFQRPLHPYTQALLSAIPSADPDRPTQYTVLTGDPPNPVNPPSGCRFRTRCVHAEDVCAALAPSLHRSFGEHVVACHMAIPGSKHTRASAA